MSRASIALAAIVSLLACELLDAPSATEPQVIGPLRTEVPRLERTVLASGLTVLSSHNTDTGTVRIAVVMRAGYDYDPAGQEGLARLCGELLESSARSPRNEVRLATLGATPEVTITRAGAELAVDVLPADAPAAVAALAEISLEPIAPELLERARLRGHAALTGVPASPDRLAAIAMARVFSPWLDRSGALGYGSASSIDSITAAHVTAYFEHARNSRDTALVVAGPIAPLQAESWALAAFSSWPQAQFRTPSGAAQVAPRERDVLFIPVAGLQQSLIVLGGLRPRSTEPDAPAFAAALDLLHARISGRLRSELRLTYGFGSNVATESDAFVLPLRVRANVTGQALAEIRREVDAQFGPSERWVAMRQVWSRTWRMDSGQHPAVMAEHARDVFLHGLALDSLERSLTYEMQPAADRVEDAARRYLEASRLGIVVVGDPASMRAQLGDDVKQWSP